MIEENKKTCINCAAEYEIKYDLPEEDYKHQFCPFCGHEGEIDEDENFEGVENRYEDWN